MTKKCGNCGSEVTEGQIYCERCKEIIDVDSIIMAKHESEEEYLEDKNNPLTNRGKIKVAIERAEELEEFVSSHKAGGAYEHSPEELEKKRKHEELEKQLRMKNIKKWITVFSIVIVFGLGILFSLKDRYSRIDSICAPQIFNGSIYYANTADNNRLYKIQEDGNGKQQLEKLSIDNFVIYKKKDGANDIYYSAPGFGIYRLDSNGKNELLIETSAQYIYPVENGFYYIPDFNGERILSLYSNERKSIRKLTLRYGDNMIYTPDGILYRGKNSDEDIWLNTDGIDIRVLPERVQSFELEGNKLVYIATDKSKNIYSIDYKARDQLRVVDAKLIIKESALSLKVSDGWIYYIKESSGNLYRCKMDGSGNSQISEKPVDHYTIYRGKVIGYMKSRLVLIDANTMKIVKLD